MRKLLFVIAMLVVFLLSANNGFADQEEPVSEPTTQEESTQKEISALQAEIQELKEMVTVLQALVASLQATQTLERSFSIGVMPIENAGRIPQVGNSFREILVSALNEVGVKATESLDDETLHWVQRQDQLVRERWIDPRSAPPRGELQGVTHYLLATITRYEEGDSELVLGGVITIIGAGTRIRKGSLVVDFRLVDARTGVALLSFRTEAKLKLKELAGAIVDSSGFGGYSRKEPLPEVAARLCAQDAAERIASLLGKTAVL